MTFDLNKLLKTAEMLVPKGTMATSGLTQRIGQLRNLVEDGLGSGAPVILDPGDIIRTGKENIPDVQISAPIASDVWYLWKTESVLPESKDEAKDFYNERLSFLEDLGFKPLRTLRSRKDLDYHGATYWSKSYFTNSGPYYVKEMRYEVVLEFQSFQYPSQKQPANEDFAAFLAFPISQLGVMRVLSMVSESMLEADGFVLADNLKPVPGNDLFPPADNRSNRCVGTHLYENVYINQDKSRIENLAGHFDHIDEIKPHRWLRYYIKKEDTWPVPGEFVGMFCKPLASSPHVWWFQETSPFLYSGNWFETQFYTSGVVTEVLEAEGDEGENHYKVKTHGVELLLRGSDFYEYEVGERVAILKKFTTDNYASFLWKDFSILEQSETLNNNLYIIPVSFY